MRLPRAKHGLRLRTTRAVEPNGAPDQGGHKMKYLILIEPIGTGFSAYSPDLPGCVSTGSTRDECQRSMQEAIEFHLEGLRAEGVSVPSPVTSAAFVEVA